MRRQLASFGLTAAATCALAFGPQTAANAGIPQDDTFAGGRCSLAFTQEYGTGDVRAKLRNSTGGPIQMDVKMVSSNGYVSWDTTSGSGVFTREFSSYWDRLEFKGHCKAGGYWHSSLVRVYD